MQAGRKDFIADRMHTALLVLLRAGLWERQPEDLSCFPLAEEDWKQLYAEACRQTVTGITFQALKYLPDEALPPEPLMIRWAAETDAIERRNSKMNEVLGNLYSAFTEKGLHPVLQKGQGVALFYEYPMLRECGDIDLYFNNEKAWRAALSFVQSQGIRVSRQADKSIYYTYKGVTVEHHTRLFDLYNPLLQRYAMRLERENGFRRTTLPEQPETWITVPSPLLNLLLLDLHILKHAVGRGIGLRQLCDMARACSVLHDDTDPDEMKAISRKFGLTEWNRLLHAFLTDSLGLPAVCLPYLETAPSGQPLADIIWRGGNFGRYGKGYDPHLKGWRRKCSTARSFARNIGFMAGYAPKESFWILMQLMKGQTL